MFFSILLLAAALRFSHLLAVKRTAFLAVLQLDHKYYSDWALRIVGGEWVGTALYFVDPLYAYFLAALYLVFGPNPLAVRTVQLFLGIATCALVGVLARRVLRSRAAMLIATLLYALFIPAIFYEGMVEKTAFSIFLLTAALVFYFGRSPLSLFASGTLLGLAALTRGNLLLLAPAGVAGLYYLRGLAGAGARGHDAAEGVDEAAPSPPIPRGQGWGLGAALFLIGVAEVVGLVAFRNFLVSGEFVLTTVNAGQNFYIGHVTGQEVGTYQTVEVARPDPRYEEDDFRAAAEKRTGRKLTATEVSDYWFAEGLREMRANLGNEVWLTLRKLSLFFHDYEIPDSECMEVQSAYSPVLRVPLLRMSTLVPLALLGAIVAWPNRRVRPLVIAVLLYCAAVVAFFVVSRLRVQIVPILAVLGAAGVLWLFETARRRDARRLFFAAVLLIVTGFTVTYRPAWMARHERSGLAVSWQNLAGQAERGGDLEAGIVAYERALEVSAPDILFSARRLGEIYLGRRDYVRAEEKMRLVLHYKPKSPHGREALVRLYEVMWNDPNVRHDDELRRKLAAAYRGVGRAADAAQLDAGGTPAAAAAPDPAVPLYAESRDLRRQGRWAEAIAKLQEAIRVGRYDEDAHYLLGALMEQHSTPKGMEEFWRGEMSHDQKPQTSLYFWAVALERHGDLDAAYAKLGEALEVDPAHEMSENRRGTIREKQRRLDEALAHYRTAAEILPDFRDAHLNAARVLTALGRPAEAQAARDLADRADPRMPRRFVSWARYLLKKGRKEAAAAELQRALQANPDDAEARELLARSGS